MLDQTYTQPHPPRALCRRGKLYDNGGAHIRVSQTRNLATLCGVPASHHLTDFFPLIHCCLSHSLPSTHFCSFLMQSLSCFFGTCRSELLGSHIPLKQIVKVPSHTIHTYSSLPKKNINAMAVTFHPVYTVMLTFYDSNIPLFQHLLPTITEILTDPIFRPCNVSLTHSGGLMTVELDTLTMLLKGSSLTQESPGSRGKS